jgi:hypothetical protein
MTSSRFGSRGWIAAVLAVAALAAAWLVLTAETPHARAQQAPTSNGWRNVNLAEYRQHLEQLDGVVSDCAAQLRLKTPPPSNENACDPGRVGPDDRVLGAAGSGSQTREVRYDWLRSVLSRTGKKGNGVPTFALGAHANTKNKPPDASALLNEAHHRLLTDEEQAGSTPTPNPAYPNSTYFAQRKSLDAILSQREYQDVARVTVRDRLFEWLDNLLDHILMRLAGIGARVPWVGRLLEGLLVAGALTVLIWLLVRLERNARVRLVPDVEPVSGTPSAREWQLWLNDAQKSAADGKWREAIHSVYWASISRLESGRIWPADRARTPREYLGLLRGADPRKPTLTALTRSFERTWYGGREAAAADFNAALHLAAELGVKAE